MFRLLFLSLALCARGNSKEEPLGWIVPPDLADTGGGGFLPPIDAAPGAGEAAKHEGEAEAAEGHETETGEGAGEGEESEESVDDVTWTTALLLIGFLVIGVGLLYLVNYPDEDIRVAMWDMINTTVSIFCGASFDFSIFRFLHNQLVLSPPPRGLGMKEDTPHIKSTMSFIFALMVGVILHMMLFKISQSNHRLLFAIRTMGGHVYAFAGILTFGFLQETHVIRDHFALIVAVPVLATGVMTLAYKIALCIAKSYGEENWWREKKIQRKNAEEMQIEAGAITVGFLIVQVLCYSMSIEEDPKNRFMPILHGIPGKHVDHCVSILFGVAVVLLIAAGFWSILLRPAPARQGGEEVNVKPWMGNFLFEYIGTVCAVTACWSLQRAGQIYLYGQLRRSSSEEMASSRSIIVNAFVMSLLAVACVCVFDKIADAFQKRNRACECDDAIDEDDVARTLSMMTTEADLANVGMGLRTVIAGFGMLVGICWDKAFETAHETVAEKIPGFHTHPVLGVGVVSGVLLSFVIPAWYWYIVPNAMKKEEDHKGDMRREEERREKEQQLLQSVSMESNEEESEGVGC